LNSAYKQLNRYFCRLLTNDKLTITDAVVMNLHRAVAGFAMSDGSRSRITGE